MKFGQLGEYNLRNIEKKTHAESKAEGLAPDLFLFFKKLYIRQKQVVSTLI